MGLPASDKGTLPTIPRSWSNSIDVVQRDLHLLSFETGEQTTLKVYCPQPCWVLAINAQVVKAIAGTDAATIDLLNSAGALQRTVSIPASSPLTYEVDGATFTPFFVQAGSFYRLTWAKTTAGGKALVQVSRRSGV
jgi:hypothetical protein